MSLMMKGVLLGVALIVISMLGIKFNIMPFRPAFLVFAIAVLLMFVLAVLSMLGIFVPVSWMKHPSTAMALVSVCVGFGPLILIVVLVGPSNFKVPPIHDISTDLDAPPMFTKAQALRQPGDNSLQPPSAEVRQQQAQAYGALRTLESDMPVDKAYARAKKIATSMGWVVHHSDNEVAIIEAYDRTSFFGFTDDIVIRIKRRDDGAMIDVRSVSRVGKSDLGANARRIMEFIQRFEAGGQS